MASKSKIKTNDKPIVVPTIKAIPLSINATKTKVVSAFGSPFRVTPNPGHAGPRIQGFTFVTAWKVEHTDAKIASFLEATERIGNVYKMYHGTKTKNIVAICAEGLRPGYKGCMFGSGIYVGGVNKAIGYARDRSVKSSSNADVCYLLEVEVALGKICECMAARKFTRATLASEGFDSVGGFANLTASYGNSKLRHNEYVVYDPDQIIVHRILEYHAGYDFRFQPPPPPTEGKCDIVVEKNMVVDKAQRAFADVINRRQCEKVSYTQVRAMVDGKRTTKVLWVCKDCVDNLRLHSGSRVQVKDSYRGYITYRLE